MICRFRSFFYGVLSLFACGVILCSVPQNVKALELSHEVYPHSIYNDPELAFSSDNVNYQNYGTHVCNFSAGTTWSTGKYTRVRVPAYTYSAGDYISVNLTFSNWAENNSLDSYFTSLYSADNYAPLISTNLSQEGGVGKVELIFYVNTDSYRNAVTLVSNHNSGFNLFANECVYTNPSIVYRTSTLNVNVNNISQADIINAINNHVNYLNDIQWDLQAIISYLRDTGGDAASAVNDLAEQQQANREEDQQNLEDAQTDAQTDASSSSADATASGQTLLQAFSSFVTALANASPSNCNINADMGHLNLGTINLCQISPPQSFQVISSIVAIGFFVPLSIASARKMISMFRSFQR